MITMSEADLRRLIDESVKHALERHTEEIATRVEQRFYARVGQTAVTQLLKLVGIVAVTAALWFAGKGLLK